MQKFYKSSQESIEIEAGNKIETKLRKYLEQLYITLHCKVVDPIFCFKKEEYFPNEKKSLVESGILYFRMKTHRKD